MNAYDLKRRHYVGNTSFEAELSLVTANQALVLFVSVSTSKAVRLNLGC
jgi:hypothetical protein